MLIKHYNSITEEVSLPDLVDRLQSQLVPWSDEQVKIGTRYTEAVCSFCKGVCCKRMGCIFHPTQIKGLSKDNTEIENNEVLKKVLETGIVAIDWWDPVNDDEIPLYYLRMRNTFSSIVDPSFFGTCILLSETTGCMIHPEYRPKEGIGMACDHRPFPDDYFDELTKAFPEPTKEQLAQDWNEYEIDWDELIDLAYIIDCGKAVNPDGPKSEYTNILSMVSDITSNKKILEVMREVCQADITGGEKTS